MSDGGITVRNDTGVYDGGEIPIYYDPLIAKLITHGPTREAAIDAQADALDAFTVEGIRHNVPFLAAVMQHPRFRAGELSTAFIAEEYPDGFHAAQPQGETASVLTAVATAIDHVLGERKRKISGQMAGRLVTRERRRVVRLGEAELLVDVWREENEIVVTFRYEEPAQVYRLTSSWVPGEVLWSGTIRGRTPIDRTVSVHVRPIANGFELAYRGIEAKVYVFTEREAEAARLMPLNKAADSGKALRCPMPGLVVSIAVAEGQEVKAGETVAVIEAMKMENVLRAERDGTVKKIHAKPGDSLAVDAVIVEFT
jgi:propionyl-CoA carboxylase alpha subunit